jgi:hypothetical protein
MADSSNTTPLSVKDLQALATKLRVHADSIRNPAAQKKLGTDLHTAADVASQMAHFRFIVAELAASLPAGNFARNELLVLLDKPDLAAAEPAFYAIFYDITKSWNAPAFLRMAHIDIKTLERATELVSETDGIQGAFYRANNPVIVECRAIATSASGTSLWAAAIAEAQAEGSEE